MKPETDDLAQLLGNQTWQVTLVAALAGVAARCACGNRPHLAYLFGLIVLMKCWVPPILSSRGGIFCWPPTNVAASGLSKSVDDQRLRDDVVPEKSSAIGTGHDGAHATTAVYTSPPAALVGEVESPRRVGRVTLAILLAVVWAAGAIGLLAIVLYQGWRWRRRLGPLTLPGLRLEMLAADLAKRLGLRRRPRVVVTSAAVGPAVFGWLRPTIVVPHLLVASAEEAKLEIVFAHEMVHIRRGDLVVGLFQSATQTVWWFHPLIWWTCRQLTRERERACDEEVLAALGCPPASYAQCLLDVLRVRRQPPLLSAIPGMGAGEVTRRRFEHILHCGPTAQGRTPLRYWLIALVVLSLVLPGERLTIATPGDGELPTEDRARQEPLATDAKRPTLTSTPIRPLDNRPPRSASETAVDDSLRLALVATAEGDVAVPSEVEKVIERAINYLEAEQLENGSWSDPTGYPGGITGLCSLALVKSGTKLEVPSVQTALGYLRQIKPGMTYSTAIQTMVFCAADPKADRAIIERNVGWLASQQKQAGPLAGAWGYPQAEGDNSNTGFALLALYEAEQIGVKANPAVWRLALDHWVKTQNENGSWGYKPNSAGTGSMTSQGLFCVAAASEVLGEQKADDPGPQAIEKAVDWLGRNFDGTNNFGTRGGQGWRFYYLHAIGLAGRTASKQRFGDHDWFAEGAQALLGEQRPDGSWRGTGHAEDNPHMSTSLALLFLLNGRNRAD